MNKMLIVLFLLLGGVNLPKTLNSTGIEFDKVLLETYAKHKEVFDKLSLIAKEKGTVAYQYCDSIPIRIPVQLRNLQRISSDYGIRFHPIYKKWRKHQGIDFVANLGTKVLSTADGVVIYIHESKYGYGKQVVVEHVDGYQTRYAHLHNILVKDGQEVRAGEEIATVGRSGTVTGAHLHYEVLKNNKRIDPLSFTYVDIKDRSFLNYYSTLIALEK